MAWSQGAAGPREHHAGAAAALQPDLNLVERVWLHLRERYLSHRLLADYEAVVDAWLAPPGTSLRPKLVGSAPSLPTSTSNKSELKRGGMSHVAGRISLNIVGMSSETVGWIGTACCSVA
jgi:hypothetical protein